MEITDFFSKSFLEKHWDGYIEKALSHKYIRKIPNSKGGWDYIYPKDFAHPMKVLLSIFGLKEEKINDAYEKNNIQEAYGVTKQGFASHLLEYLSNRDKWNKLFAEKFNRDRFKTPEKTNKEKTSIKTDEIKNNGKATDKKVVSNETTADGEKWNKSLMRKIYSMYNQIPEDKKVENPSGPVAFNVGDSVSYKGKVGKVTKDFGNGMYFVNFDDGGMGRINAIELQKLNPSDQEISAAADVNAVEQEVEQNRNDVVSDNPAEEINVRKNTITDLMNTDFGKLP